MSITAVVLVHFPQYAAMAAILTRAPGRGGVTVSEHLADLFTSVGDSGAFAVVIALYTALLGLMFHLPVVLLLWLLGMTFDFEPPVMP